jgi:type I restriction-modification system DNA methylase subunit
MSSSLSLAEIKKRLTAFARQFKDAANEQQQASIFWTRFYECYGIRPESATIYEQAVNKLSGGRGRIDSFIPGKLIVEHKSRGKNLAAAYEQAQEYFMALPEAERPRYIITSDFARIHLYDLKDKKHGQCDLEQLPQKASWFKFLLEDAEASITEETPINRDAAYAISKLHEALLRANFKGRDLEVFLTRLLFCLFADDTSIFGENNIFRRLVERTRQDGTDLGARLAELFDVLNQPETDRQRNLDDTLAAFAYVNGSLFSDRTRTPAFDSGLRDLLMTCIALDWSQISPAIFGAMFQGVLEEHDTDARRQATRRELGAHYTSERNILRVINPLFMDDLRAEFEAARRSKPRLQALYDKLPNLTFFDPACGCGNFLVIAYRELRRLENEVIAELFNVGRGRGLLDVSTLCRVKVNQFYGIEIDEAAAHIARVALWITDHQQNLEAAKRFGNTRATVPLVDSPHIQCANALQIEWEALLPSAACSFVFGNPPFVGKKEQSADQKRDLELVFGRGTKTGVLDYVTAWYIKAANYIQQGGQTKVAFVSTNSIAQGEQVGVLWGKLLPRGARIHFAHRTFKWSNEGKGVAAVHCVIVGFSNIEAASKVIFDYGKDVKGEPVPIVAKRINGYLVDADNVLLRKVGTPICPASPMNYGSMPIDNGHLILSPEDREVVKAEVVDVGKVVRQYMGGEEFLNKTLRYCLWLKDVDPQTIRGSAFISNRVRLCREFRLASERETTQELAKVPALFGEIRQPVGDFLVVPKVSSENREYMPIGFVHDDIVVSGSALIVPNATLFDFGVLTSCMHMAWMRAVCGRLESRYQYSAGIVYNNFPWPDAPRADHKGAIEKSAKAVLDAREAFPESTLADLYDPLAMPPALQKAHQQVDRAVDAAYGYKGHKDDASRVAFLFELYQQYTSLLPARRLKVDKER